ncbi:Ctr copper transporter family-domain-containing protein [Pseudomassariella vexata]|uniref:Copper transport protein n=1 Tax=Pseudomassariella vexata TaxID=1141098 RepID=A0A1Y2EHC9_9PEZI|nr:Ctr copper transporter family-domain-containing protein [Pseudomassariella vexata]ORY70971.1 Ctr copper transporter family-domain-containing protein [Pseudomassariella vexata]
MDDMDMSSNSTSDCKITMLWNWYTIDACFLSTSWHITNNGMFAATCIGIMLLVVILELLRRVGKEFDAHILRQFQRQVEVQASAPKDTTSSGNGCGDTRPPPPAPRPQVVVFRATPLQQLIRSVIHAVTFGLAYVVMLLAMYFNGYIIISIIIGAGIGKFLCDWMVHKVVVGTASESEEPTGIEEPSVCCG